MMSGDLPGLRGGRRLSVPVNARRFSALSVPGSGSNGHGGHGARRLSALIEPVSHPTGQSHGARRLSALVPESVVRRLSNVSTTLGLGKPAAQECLVEQGKALCALYMRSRIRAAGVAAGAGAEARAATCAQLSTPWPGARAVFPRLSQLGRHLERARPRLYSAVGRHAVPVPAAQAPDAGDIAYGIGMELFKDDITWGKIVSLMAVCGALASEPRANCDLSGLLEAAAALMRGSLLPWLSDHGGWYGLLEHSQPLDEPLEPDETEGFPASYTTAALILLTIIVILTWLLLRDMLLP